MKCHYEVLGVPLDVDTKTLRTAYKKCALKWHPDKNLDNVEKAKEEFQLVQQAFEVLSDPHERAWYDTHREAILKGGIGKDYKDDSINLFPYFSSTCYQGYGDNGKGFYAVYREVFHQIYAEDVDFDLNEDSNNSVPNFGNSDSSYEEVVHPFYAYWENYCTTKTFVWLDEFDVREAPNRRVMRLMEKENKKIREKARKERNEEIRQLVRFVRKRDKRLEKHRKHLEERAAENAKKAQLNRLRQLEERKREIAEMTQAEWAKMHNVESELQKIEDHLTAEFGDNQSEEENDTDDNTESVVNHLYCVACNKIFKNVNSFANHESSKKHKENVAALNVPVDDDIVDSNDDQTYSNLDGDEKESYLQEVETSGSKKKIKGKKVLKPLEEYHTSNGADGLNSVNEDAGDEVFFAKSKKQIKKKNKKKSKVNTDVNTGIVEQSNSEVGAIVSKKPASRKAERDAEKKPRKKQQSNSQNKESNEELKRVEDTASNDHVDNTSEGKDCEDNSGTLMNHLQCLLCNMSFKDDELFDKHESTKEHQDNMMSLLGPIKDDVINLTDSTDDQAYSDSDNEEKQDSIQEAAASSSKRKERRKNELKPKEEHHINNAADGLNSADEEAGDRDFIAKSKKQVGKKNKKKDLSLTCAVCNSIFQSKNKLFSHLKTSGHSVHLPKAVSSMEEKSNKCRNKNSKY